MAEHFASGNWHVTRGKEQEFIERWTEFLEWTKSSQPAFVNASLIQDEQDPRHFISFAEWKDPDARNTWKQDAGFQDHFSACRALCDDMRGSDYNRRVTI